MQSLTMIPPTFSPQAMASFALQFWAKAHYIVHKMLSQGSFARFWDL
jgi:hypothetical protein